MVCAHCGSSVPVPRGSGTIVERALEEAGSAAHGLGIELRVARCARCGAQVTFDERTTSKGCVFCGSPQVLEQEANRNALRPESLVPLDIGRATVEKEFRAWLGRLWFRPSALRRMRDFRAVGVYVPFWTFDARVRSDWTADAGYYYWVTEPTVVIVRGRPSIQMRQVRKIRWEPAYGARDDRFDDLLVHASKGLPVKLAAELGRFDTSALVPYRPEYLAGWRAEEYAVDLATGFESGKAEIEKIQAGRCGGDVPGDTHRNLSVRNHVSEVRWKHVLLPVWSLTYSFAGKEYPVLIHGQTGRVVGEAPYSWVKILLLVLGIASLVLLALAILSVAG
ncbi:MAG: primosomal protein N' (replication factor Y) - superfamily II helicase [Planctomycetota bacterium]